MVYAEHTVEVFSVFEYDRSCSESGCGDGSIQVQVVRSIVCYDQLSSRTLFLVRHIHTIVVFVQRPEQQVCQLRSGCSGLQTMAEELVRKGDVLVVVIAVVRRRCRCVCVCGGLRKGSVIWNSCSHVCGGYFCIIQCVCVCISVALHDGCTA